MSTLVLLKNLALKEGDDYLNKCLTTLDKYIDKHSCANIKALIDDNYVNVYDGPVFLLKVSTVMLNEMGCN